MSGPGRVVIVGGGAGGDAAAAGLRKQGYMGEVILVSGEADPPYERPHLSKQFLRGETDRDRVLLRPAGEYGRMNIDFRPGVTVVDGEPISKELTLDNGDRLDYDTLVLAPGSTPRALPSPAADNIRTLRTLQDAVTLKGLIDESQRILVLGAGFIGAEVAASARQMGKDVLLVEMAEVPLERVLGREVGAVYATMHREHGVDLRLGVTVTEWHSSGARVTAVELSDGSHEKVDCALVAIGVTPNLTLGTALGLTVGPQGVATDECLLAAPGIYAIGDIAAHQHPVYGRPLRVEHWQVAQRQGTAVATSIATEARPYSELPWFWSDQYEVNLQYVGNAAGFDSTVTRGDLAGDHFSVFYLNQGVIDAVLSVNDGRSGRFSRPLISGRVSIPPEARSILAASESDLRAFAASLTN